MRHRPRALRTAALSGVLLCVVAIVAPRLHANPGRLSPDAIASFVARYGQSAENRLLDWEELMHVYWQDGEPSKREITNDFFNRIPWLSDLEHWGKRDYWATPMEMLGTNGGDCEDYSIAKYFTLTEMAVPRDKLLITYVRAPKLNQTHMVLAYYATPDADPLILDNLDGEIRYGSERSDLIPVYSFNAEGLWMAIQQGRGRRVGAADRLSLWRDVTRRMALEHSPGAGSR